MSGKGNKQKEKKQSSGKKKEVPEPYILILAGLPGSGKSTLSTELEKFGWVRICQDVLGSADECKKLMDKSLKHGRSVIIDRCNVHGKERKIWVNEGKKYTSKIECLYLNTPIDECKQRVKGRKKHETLDAADGDKVIDEFARGLQEPKQWEGPYSKVMIVAPSEVKQIIKELSQYPISKKVDAATSYMNHFSAILFSNTSESSDTMYKSLIKTVGGGEDAEAIVECNML